MGVDSERYSPFVRNLERKLGSSIVIIGYQIFELVR